LPRLRNMATPKMPATPISNPISTMPGVQHLVAGVAEDAQVERSGVQIDAAVKCVLLLVEVHRHGLLWDGTGA
jgi:hypothetical protein